MRIGLAQMNASIGDLVANGRKITHFYHQARQVGVDLLVFPELSLCGYPPGRLVRQSSFLIQCHQALQRLAQTCTELPMMIGWPDSAQGGQPFNAAALLRAGRIDGVYYKGRLPAFHAFDETRFFQSGPESVCWDIHGLRVLPTICYDLWDIDWLTQRAARHGPIDLVLNLSASPLDEGKLMRRERTIRTAAEELHCGVAYCNLVGRYPELVFDGRSMIADGDGQIQAQAKAFEEDLLLADLQINSTGHLGVSPRSSTFES